MSQFLIAGLFTAASLSGFLPAPPSDEMLPTYSKAAAVMIFEWSDYGGTASTAKARETAETARQHCKDFIDQAHLSECADIKPDPTVFTATANCKTGELWSIDGRKYLFDDKINNDDFWNGWIAMKDAVTGKRVATDNASGGIGLGMQWMTLCPLGLPYDRLQPQAVLQPADYSGMGTLARHNGSSMFFDQSFHTVTYTDPKPSLAGVVAPNTVLFRGWIILGGPMSGVAYTFKKGCPPAPYLVHGYNQNSMQLVLEGAAPVRKGCKVVGYNKKSSNARLVIDLPPE